MGRVIRVFRLHHIEDKYLQKPPCNILEIDYMKRKNLMDHFVCSK